MNRLPVIYGHDLDGNAPSSVALSICRHWNDSGLETTLYAPSKTGDIEYPWVRVAMGWLKKKIVPRFGGAQSPTAITESYGLKSSEDASHIYLWAGLSLDIYENAKKQGRTIIIERSKCHQKTVKKTLDKACKDAGLGPDHGITQASIEAEKHKLELADAIFCPSPLVRRSMLDGGVAEDKLLDTSSGWSPEQFPSRREGKSGRGRKPLFLFVGSVCIGNGVPLLLEAWKTAGIHADLVLCGTMDTSIQRYVNHYCERPDITHIPFTPDIGGYYNRAEALVFPTCEEGGAPAIYEAMAHGALPLVSETGAGAIVEHKKNGLVIEQSVDAWANTIRAVCMNTPRSRQLAKAAVTSAQSFTWESVAAQRAALLKNKFPELWKG